MPTRREPRGTFFSTRPAGKESPTDRTNAQMKEREQTPHDVPQTSETPEPSKRPQGAFTSLNAKLQRAISEEGYVEPTPIQERAIPHLLRGEDLIGTAQTGTGKTAAFTLPLLQNLAASSHRPAKGAPRALILAPTRELAAQIEESIRTYGRHLKLTHTVIFGGVNQHRQVKALSRGVDVLVATPGRLLDLMGQGYLRLDEVNVFILDEVDRMLDMGFIPDVKRILAKLPKRRQTLFFSATMPPKMEALAKTMVTDPARIAIAPEKPAVEVIKQRLLYVRKKKKNDLLASLLKDPAIKKVVVFTQMKHAANRVVKKLDAAGIRAVAIHGNKSQAARIKALDGFKNGSFRVLVATDVAARGLDIDDVTHVINYDLPVEAETYVHRIGRTARAGAEGAALSFCCAEEKEHLATIEHLLGKAVPVDLAHDFHCEESMNAVATAPKPGPNRRGGKRRRGGRAGGGNRKRSEPAGDHRDAAPKPRGKLRGRSGRSRRPV